MATSADLLGTPAEFARRIGAATAAGVFFGLIGPFGSYDAPPIPRVASWLVFCWAGVLLLGAAYRLSTSWTARTGAPRLFTRLAAASAASLPLAAIAVVTSRLLMGATADRGGWLVWYAQVLAITLPVSLAYVLIETLGRPQEQAAALSIADRSHVPPEILLDLVPARLGRNVVALQMQDHYVRVHTPLGSELVLMSMTTALKALSGVKGRRVHRSWWVARSAVEAVVSDGRNVRLQLVGGLKAAVARSAVAELRADGWLSTKPLDGPSTSHRGDE